MFCEVTVAVPLEAKIWSFESKSMFESDVIKFPSGIADISRSQQHEVA